MSRRAFLGRAAAGAAVLPVLPSLLAACGDGGSTGGDAAVDPRDLSRPDNPVTLPLVGEPIPDGLEPEDGPLSVFNYAEYVNPATLRSFERRYGVKVKVTSFNSMDEARSKLNAGVGDFDVFFPTTDVLARVVARKQLQPLNRSYLPNLANVWDELQDPFYDRGARYTVPYTVYTTGVGYRRDLVPRPPEEYENPYDILWDRANRGHTWLLDDDREVIGMALLRRGVTDVNTEDPKLIARALRDLQALDDAVSVSLSAAAYEKLPSGEAHVHQAWSGDAVNARQYLPEGTTIDQIGYWYPPDGRGVVGSDTIAVMAGAAHPVLAHHFLNFLLDERQALENYRWLGYQPPQRALDPDRLVAEGLVPEHLTSAVVRPEDFAVGSQLLQLTPDGEKLWDAAFARFKSGA
jgi:spermidine/putrescine transport system substrate-binding protein